MSTMSRYKIYKFAKPVSHKSTIDIFPCKSIHHIYLRLIETKERGKSGTVTKYIHYTMGQFQLQIALTPISSFETQHCYVTPNELQAKLRNMLGLMKIG